jgi:CHASE3 domain sensor protein
MSFLGSFKAQAALGFAMAIILGVGGMILVLFLDRVTSDRREQAVADYSTDIVLAKQLQLGAERMVAASRGYLITRDPMLLRRMGGGEVQVDEAVRELRRIRRGSREPGAHRRCSDRISRGARSADQQRATRARSHR